MPPPLEPLAPETLLPLIVQLVMVRVPVELTIPPPDAVEVWSTELFITWEFVSVAVLLPATLIPPPPIAKLPLTILLFRFKLPEETDIPPPANVVGLPPVMVTSFNVRVALKPT